MCYDRVMSNFGTRIGGNLEFSLPLWSCWLVLKEE